jgi:hypothetical protein
VPLLHYLNDNRVNTICWVSSALSSIAALGGLEAEKPTTLRTVHPTNILLKDRLYNYCF